MKKAIIKTLSVFLAVILSFAAAPISGFIGFELPEWFDFSITSSAAETSGAYGDNLNWAFDNSSGTLTISGTGEMQEFELPSDAPWFSHNNDVKKIQIADGVTTISEGAFFNLENLVSVSIADSVKSINEMAFAMCVNLKNVTIGNGVTLIGDSAFLQCINLENIIIPDSVEIIGDDSFGECFNLKSLTLGNNITTIGKYAFAMCESLTNVTIPDSVISIGEQAFCSCTNLTNVTIGNNVTTIGEMAFGDCVSLKSVIIPDSVIEIGEMAFLSCESLESVTIGNGLNTINYATFLQCSNLKEVTIGSNVTTIGEMAFAMCESLTNVTIPDSVTTIDNSAFLQCTNLESVTIGKNVSTIGEMAFAMCESLTNVTIPDSVTTINYGTFLNCKNLTYITFGENVTIIGEFAFSGCDKLVDLTIPDSVTTIDYAAFLQCTSLTSITIPESVTAIAPVAFGECTNISNIIVSSDNQCYSNDEDGVLYNKDKTTLILYPNGNTRTIYTIPKSVAIIEDSAFYDCPTLTDIYYNGSEEEWKYIDIREDNNSLRNATIHFNAEHRHEYSIAFVVAPTCTEAGYTTYTCSCGESYNADYVEPSHTITTVIIPSTCETDGSQYDTCTVCGEIIGSTIVIPATGHTILELKLNEVEPSCNSEGSYDRVVVCAICDKELVRETILLPATGEHSFNIESKRIEPTCKDDGFVVYSCTCGETNTITVPALGHNYEPTVITPTCTTSGYTTYTCSICNDSYDADVTEALGHTEEVIPSTAPTCLNDGVSEGVICSVCKVILVAPETIPATGHTAGEIVIENSTPATCKQNGRYEEVVYCTVCKEELSRVEKTVEKLPHSYETIIIAPTCTEQGCITYTCAVCNDTYIADTIPAFGHDMITDKAVAPSCTETGLTEGAHCSRCNDATTKQEEIPALGHSYESVVTPPTCTEDGYTTYTCSICNDTYTGDETEAGHNFVNGVCSLCGEKDSTNVLIGDVNEDGRINTLDRVILTRYIAKWEEYPAGSINTVAADVNCDGKVNTLDRVILTRYIAKWEGYETLPYTG